MKELATDPDQPEGVRFFAAVSYADTWDDHGIALMDEVLKGLKSRVLLHAALQKMLHDYRFQFFKTASADKFRELIASTDAYLHGSSNAQKGELISALLENAKAEE
jgi:hypothetical protein